MEEKAVQPITELQLSETLIYISAVSLNLDSPRPPIEYLSLKSFLAKSCHGLEDTEISILQIYHYRESNWFLALKQNSSFDSIK